MDSLPSGWSNVGLTLELGSNVVKEGAAMILSTSPVPSRCTVSCQSSALKIDPARHRLAICKVYLITRGVK